MLQSIRRRAAEEKGFTLIELLVVILIIGILAAIALPSFINQRTKGQDAEAKSAVRTAQTADETYYTDNQAYATSFAQLTAIEPALNNAPKGSGGATNPTAGGYQTKGYTITVASKSGTTFTVSRDDNGVVVRSCSGSSGGCNGGSW